MKKIYMVFILGLIGICILTGCSFSINKDIKFEKESTFEKFDVDYTTNNDGTYTYKDSSYKYIIDVSGTEADTLTIFRILTNNKKTSFEDISSSLKKSDVSNVVPEFVILGWKSDKKLK